MSGDNNASLDIWNKFRSSLISKIVHRFNVNLLWEVGSGEGNVSIPLTLNNQAVICIEPIYSGAYKTAKMGLETYQGTLSSMNFPNSSITAIGCFDVLEHLENPSLFLREIFRILTPGGYLFTTVPLHQFLFSDFDKFAGHFKRYSKKSLSQELDDSGFHNIQFVHLFAIFIVPAMLSRILFSRFRYNRVKKNLFLEKYTRYFLKLLTPIIFFFLKLEFYFKIPIGLSLLSVSRKKTDY